MLKTTGQLAKEFGFKPRTFRLWAKQGIIKPVATAGNHGIRLFTSESVRKQLIEAGKIKPENKEA